MTTITIDPIKPLIGGIVHVDKANLCDDQVVRQCLEALDDRGVLVFPGINLTDEEQLAFTDKLGHRVNFTRTIPGGDAAAPDVYKITLDKTLNNHPEYVYGTYFWHMDGVTMDMPPPKATLLTARTLAPRGGQTEFASTYAAYEQLPDEEKKALEGLRVLHTLTASLRLLDKSLNVGDAVAASSASEMEHPLVWKHTSGRKSLLIGTHADYILGMSIPEGRALLTRLLEWAGQPAFRYTHQWQQGDLVIWDNCGTLHRVIPYDPESGRTMHRTTVAGTEVVPGSRVHDASSAA